MVSDYIVHLELAPAQIIALEISDRDAQSTTCSDKILQVKIVLSLKCHCDLQIDLNFFCWQHCKVG